MRYLVLLFIGLPIISIILSCSARKISQNKDPKPPPMVIEFEKPAQTPPPAVLIIPPEVYAPDTVYSHTETVKEILGHQVLSDWFEDNMNMFQPQYTSNDQLVKLITDYQISINENKELMTKYLSAIKEKEEVKQTVKAQEYFWTDTNTIMVLVIILLNYLTSLKYRYSRKRLERLIRELKESR